MAYEKYKHKTKIKGQDTHKRKLLNNFGFLSACLTSFFVFIK